MIAHVLPRTMRARLAVLFALSTSIILAISGTLFYEGLSVSTAQSLRHEMQASLARVIAQVAAAHDVDELRIGYGEIHDEEGGHQHLNYALFDQAGALLAKSEGFAGVEALTGIPSGSTPEWIEDPRRATRYLVAMTHLADPDSTDVLIAIQGEYRNAMAFLRLCALSIVLGVLGGAVIAAIVAHRISAFALKPLSQLAARADEISSSRLADPLPDSDMAGELRELSQAFNRMLERLDESFKRLSQFSSDLAHDIRTPLTNLLAQAQVALSQPRSNAQYRAVIESSIEEFQRLSRMVDDMLFLARADARQRKTHFRHVDARREASLVARYFEPIGEDRDVTIAVQGQCSFEGDPLLVQRAIGNLLANACAYAPRGSTVTIECGCESEVAIVSVTDTGVGIDGAHLERIFDRFYRGDPARQRSASGTGLGLAIVKSIMQEHGGKCEVVSLPGMRTTFSLHFPRSRR